MADFLLELRSEEIPARMQARAREELARLFEGALAEAGLSAERVATYTTPRRLALIATGLPPATADTREERRGPRADAPEKAIEGFLKSTGLSRDRLETREDPKGAFLYAVIERPGRPTAQVLAEILPAVVERLAWPKSMRWGGASESMESPRWVRPLHGVVALLDEAVVPFQTLNLSSGRTTFGHRFMSEGAVEIERPGSYADQLRAARVILDQDERAAIITAGAEEAARAAGLSLVPDPALAAENAGLTEWPVPLLGRFDPAFLEVPREVIQLTMRTNQKYFACREAVPLTSQGYPAAHPESGALAPAFVATANIAAPDGGAAIVEGNRKVLAARLADARFFWKQDLKQPLEGYLPKLAEVVFHEKLGTMADKAERVARLARWLAETAVPGADPALAERAGRLCKADLVTSMVGEFPELQGVIGGYYAEAAGEDPQVAAAVRELYEPGMVALGQAGPVSIAVSLADRADTLRSFFAIGEVPTGSRDPYALRRAALQSATLIFRGHVRAGGRELFGAEAFAYVLDRYKHQLTGGRHDVVDAVLAVADWDDDLYRIGCRYRALADFTATDDGQNLLTGYKRAANILAIEEKRDGTTYRDPPNPQPGEPPEQQALREALDHAIPQAEAAVQAEDFTAAMAALAQLRAPIDAFFDHVTVNDPDPDARANRLRLLNRIREAVHRVADFSRIEG